MYIKITTTRLSYVIIRRKTNITKMDTRTTINADKAKNEIPFDWIDVVGLGLDMVKLDEGDACSTGLVVDSWVAISSGCVSTVFETFSGASPS